MKFAKGQIYEFLLTCLLRGMTEKLNGGAYADIVSTHMPLARHDVKAGLVEPVGSVSTHMPLARHDGCRSVAKRLPQEFLLTCLLRGMTQSILPKYE